MHAADRSVAIIGMAAQLPAGLGSPAALEAFLADRGCAIGADAATPGAADYAARLDLPPFDHAFFRMPAREMDTLDPQHGLLLETCWHALEDAGLRPSALRGAPVGVFVGVSSFDHAAALAARGVRDVFLCTGNAHAAAAGRLSFAFGLTGPSMAVDTACSASLTALHLARQSLLSGECEMALVAAVNVARFAPFTQSLALARMLSPSGCSRAFSALADGYVRGEGCVALVLKRADLAWRDGDAEHGLVVGSALNQDGASASLTAPNGLAQQRVMRAALADAGVAPHAVAYLEAHGTGTALGDPVELKAVSAVYGRGASLPDGTAPLIVGSVKNNLGHLEAAAGLLSLVKVLRIMRRGRLLPTIHAEPLSTHVDWAALNVAVALDESDLARRGPDVAAWGAVSAFSFAGSNAHVILAPARARPATAVQPCAETAAHHVLAVSAASPPSLAALAQAHAQALAGLDEPALAAWCAAAARGREPMRYRAAWVSASVDDLRAQLAAFDGLPMADIRARVTTPALASRPADAAEERCAAFLRGADPAAADADAHAQAKPPCIGTRGHPPALPLYPFDRTRARRHVAPRQSADGSA